MEFYLPKTMDSYLPKTMEFSLPFTSAFGNLYPLAKFANWRNIFSTQSLKLQMMAAKTDSWGSWDETKRKEILAMENDLLQLLKEYIY